MKLRRVAALAGLFVFCIFITTGYVLTAASEANSPRRIEGPAAVTNEPPLADADSYTVHRNLRLFPLVNDSDPEGDALSIGSFTQPTHGSVSPYSPTSVIYTAGYGYVGADSFTYSACDGMGACADGTVNISIVNQPPTAQPDTFSVHGNLLLVPLANDSDPDVGDGISIADMVNQPTQHGWLNPYGPNLYMYTASYGYVGPDGFDYTVCDDLGACSVATVSINVVNQSPVARPDLYTVRAPLQVVPRQNDFDPDAQDSLVMQGITTQPQHGSLTAYNADVFTYNAYGNYTGSDSFSYTVCDGLGACSVGTVTLWIIGDGENDGVCTNCNRAGPSAVGGPVNVTNGNMYLQQGDYELAVVGPGINVTRTYNSNSQRVGMFGRGWTTLYDESINMYDVNLARFSQSDGRAVYLGQPAGSSGPFAALEADFHGTLQNGGGNFTLTTLDGSSRQFNSAGRLISLRDRNGNQTTITYDVGGTIASVTDAFGRMLLFNSNSAGQVLSLSDALGIVATYDYGPSNELLSVTYPDNSRFQFSYDSNLRLTSVSDALGNVIESHAYDSQGRAVLSEKDGAVDRYTLSYNSGVDTVVTDGLGRITRYTFDTSKGRNVVTEVEGFCNCGSGSQTQTWTYDGQLNVVSRTNALSQTSNYTYDSNGNRLTATDSTGTVSYTYNQFGQVLTRTDQMGGVYTNTYDSAGNLLSANDELNNPTTFTYDGRGQLLTMTNPLGKVTTLTWDSNGRLIESKDALNNTTGFAYDVRGRLLTVTDPLNALTSFTYDAAGRVSKVTRADNSFITYTYDLAGRRTKVTDALNNATTFAYDNAYRLIGVTDAALKTITFGYDAMSNLNGFTDALADTTNYSYDEFNRLTKTVYPPAIVSGPRMQETVEYDSVGNITKRTDTSGRTTSFSYDNANRLSSVTDPALQTTQYEYDPLSNVTAVIDAIGQRYTFDYDALSRPTAAGRAGVQMSIAYDATGNQISRTDYNNMVTAYSYDALNRLSKITYPDASTVTYAYDKRSQLTRATNINGTVSFVYDSLGRVISSTDVFGQVLNYSYDANDRRTKLTVGTTTNANYFYDVVDRLTKITDAGNQSITYAYDAAGKITSRTLPNSVVTTYLYDGLARLTRLKDAKGKTAITDNQYSYNSAGDLTQNIEQGGTHNYVYDNLERLISASYTGNPNESYAYDGVGNRTSSHRSAIYGYQPTNRLVSTSTANYAYDNNGNVISRNDSTGTTQFAWDFENRLTQVVSPASGSVAYKYDALGRRIQRQAPSGTSSNFVYDGQDVVKDINSDGTTIEYLNAPGVDAKIRQKGPSNSTTYYFLQDHLGSATVLTGTTGKVVERLAYDGFGNSGGSARTRYGFTGRERDQLTGLLYYRARFYDPQLGRFISEDPIGLGGGINSFAYVSNNPQNATDPSGLYEIDVHYYLTYFLAKKTGCFSEMEARAVARGDQGVDDNKSTSPGPGTSARQRRVNAFYHGLHPGSHLPFLIAHWSIATEGSGNLAGLGAFLHYRQDMFSHKGYTSPVYGHATGFHAVDKTNHDVSKALQMARATWDTLNEFAAEKKCGCRGRIEDSWWKQVEDFAKAPAGGAIDSRARTIGEMNEAFLDRKIDILGVTHRY